MRYTYLLWDWNGTLTDDQKWAMQAVNDMLNRRGREPITPAQYYDFLETPIRKFYEHLFDLEQENYDSLLKEYNTYYAAYMQQYGTLRPGISSFLKAACQRGITQWVTTASRREEVVGYLRRFHVDAYFDKIVGADNYHSESKIDRVCAAVRECGITPSQMLVIGDTLHDLEMANTLQADCVLLTGGHHSTAMLTDHHAHICHSVEELKKDLEL